MVEAKKEINFPTKGGEWEGITDPAFTSYLAQLSESAVVYEGDKINLTATMNGMVDFFDPISGRSVASRTAEQMRLLNNPNRSELFEYGVVEEQVPFSIADIPNTLLIFSYLYARREVGIERNASRVRLDHSLPKMAELWEGHPMADVVDTLVDKYFEARMDERGKYQKQSIKSDLDHTFKRLNIDSMQFRDIEDQELKTQIAEEMSNADRQWVVDRLALLEKSKKVDSIGYITNDVSWKRLGILSGTGVRAEFVRRATLAAKGEVVPDDQITQKNVEEALMLIKFYMDTQEYRNVKQIYDRFVELVDKYPDRFGA